VKLQQTPKQAGDIEVKTGPQRLTSGIRMLVLKAGDKTGCFKCGESNHMAKDCPKKRKPVSYADIVSSQTESNDGQIDADAEHALEQVRSEMDINEPELIVEGETLRDDQHSTIIEEAATPTTSTVSVKSKRKQMTSPSESDKTSKQGRQEDPNSSYQDYSSAESELNSSTDGEVEELENTVSEHPSLPPDASTPKAQVQ
jgi:hypothetical protein